MRGDNMAMKPFAKLLWTLVIIVIITRVHTISYTFISNAVDR